MRTLSAALFLFHVGAAYGAEDEEVEYYLLGDLGVRVDLPEDWQPERGGWSDWSFEAEKTDRSVKVFVWGQDVQIEPVEADLEAWSSVFVDKVESIGGKAAKVDRKALATVGGRPTARFELSFDFGKDLAGVMSGATFAVEGKMVHAATITAAQRAAMAPAALEVLLERLEVRKPPAALAFGGHVEAAGVAADLPQDWRTPLANELAAVGQQARKLGVEELDGCWTAMRPHANAELDVMVTCQGGMLLGVVDEYSFDGVEEVLRGKLFPGAEVPAAERIANADGRVGFLYRPTLAAHTLRLGIVPFGKGIARTWMLGATDEGAEFDVALRQVLETASYEGEHPTGFGDVVSYYLTYRRTSPVVIGLGMVLLALLGGLVTIARRSGRDRYADLA